MGVYINTFRTEHKTAQLNGQPIKVYAFRYLCNLSDTDDHWGERKQRAAMMQARMEQAKDAFGRHKPTYVAQLHDSWEGTTVLTDVKSAVNYDTESISETVVGFMALREGRRQWVISSERRGETGRIVAGLNFRERYLDAVVDGKVVRTILSYVCLANNAVLTKEAFLAWEEKAVPEYLAACEKLRQEEHEREMAAVKVREAKLAAKDAEIVEAQKTLIRLQQERAAIYQP